MQISYKQERYLSTNLRGGFSLVELLIVIAIISLFGFFIFDSLKRSETKPKLSAIKDIKSILASSNEADLICIDKCSKCFIVTAGMKSIQEVPTLLKDMQAYTLDENDNPRKIEFGRFNDRPICLRFHQYSNGSTSQLILESQERFFYLPSYFGQVEEFETIDEATTRWLDNSDIPKDDGNYY